MRFFLAVLLIASSASADDRGGVGENCRSRSDCEEGLKCVSFTCTAPSGATPPPVSTSPATSPTTIALRGVHFFVGVDMLFSLTIRGLTTGSDAIAADWSVHAGFLPALHAGVLLGRHELSVE